MSLAGAARLWLFEVMAPVNSDRALTVSNPVFLANFRVADNPSGASGRIRGISI